jgi:hypothetical protein
MNFDMGQLGGDLKNVKQQFGRETEMGQIGSLGMGGVGVGVNPNIGGGYNFTGQNLINPLYPQMFNPMYGQGVEGFQNPNLNNFQNPNFINIKK